ncbi:uncharacterized protein PADG_02009 [Paracoccidioides brasiliensis Pb18]|uniref:Uncharacterized protein n=1 Tax=Paracoccidioides brasiliensis (strain Pb18) TaxID=502780 RepID=C1G4Z3_PARBD|nr:uncharacterized protein PADG_02009 [Paracoccidioides brasiliensis Pb18]EEH45859.2 hypothetical protein PADG_02009 [Paracoccidioides brasiliensis Pb18]
MVSCGRDQDFGYYQIHTPQGKTVKVSRACQVPTSPDFQVERRTLSGIETVWHSVRLEIICPPRYIVPVYFTQTGSSLAGVVARRCLQCLKGYGDLLPYRRTHNIGPAFPAHITENGDRVIGYAAERIPGRRATIALPRLHTLDIARRALNISVFLVADDGHVVQHGFSGSFLTGDDVAHAKYMDSLEDMLWQSWLPPRRRLDHQVGEKLEEIDKRDDGIHAVALGQAVLQDKGGYQHGEARKTTWRIKD